MQNEIFFSCSYSYLLLPPPFSSSTRWSSSSGSSSHPFRCYRRRRTRQMRRRAQFVKHDEAARGRLAQHVLDLDELIDDGRRGEYGYIRIGNVWQHDSEPVAELVQVVLDRGRRSRRRARQGGAPAAHLGVQLEDAQLHHRPHSPERLAARHALSRPLFIIDIFLLFLQLQVNKLLESNMHELVPLLMRSFISALDRHQLLGSVEAHDELVKAYMPALYCSSAM